MRKIVTVTLSFIVCALLYSSVLGVHAASAAVLKFDSPSYTVQPNDTLQVQIIVDPGTEQISGTDAYVLYDPTLLEAQGVTAANYFPSVSNTITAGKVSVWGVVDNPAIPKSGVGTIASITFKALKTGTGNLQYFCDLSVNNTSKIVKSDINATNIIECSNNGSSIVTVGGGGPTSTPFPSGGPSLSPIPTATPNFYPTASASATIVASASATLTPTRVKVLPTSGAVGTGIVALAFPGILLLIMGGIIRVLL